MNGQISDLSLDGPRLPLLQLGSRFGFLGAWAKRTAARVIRFFIVYQMSVNEQFHAQIRELTRRADAADRALEQLRVLNGHIITMDASLSQVRIALAKVSTSLPQQISLVDDSVRAARDAISSLQAGHESLEARLSEILESSAEIQDRLQRVDERFVHSMSPAVADRVVEITTSQLNETIVRFGDPSDATEPARGDATTVVEDVARDLNGNAVYLHEQQLHQSQLKGSADARVNRPRERAPFWRFFIRAFGLSAD